MRRTRYILLFVLLMVAVGTVGIGSAQSVSTMDEGGRAPANDSAALVVDDDGTAEYTAIQAAVADTRPGDTVVVRPGTYREQVTIGKNITVVAPDGATLDGSQFEERPSAFRIQGGVVPVIDGFTIREYAYGIDADRPPKFGVTESDWDVGWIVRNVTIRNCSEEAIRAGSSMTDWTIESVRIEGEGCYAGIAASGSRGDWTIRNTIVHGVAFDGINVGGARGEWTIRNTSITDAGDGVDVGFSGGDGTIADTTVRNVETGIAVDDLYGTVAVTDTIIANVSHPPDDPAYNGVAIYAANTTGDWQISGSIIRNYTRFGINATGSSPPGDATGNWWEDDGSGDDACIGNVRCGNVLSSKPEAGATLGTPGAPSEREIIDTATRTSTLTSRYATDDRITTPTSTRADDRTETSTGSSSISDGNDRTGSRERSSAPLVPAIGGVIILGAAVIGVLLGGLFVRTRG